MKEPEIAPAKWPQDSEIALRLLTNYQRHLADCHLKAADACLSDFAGDLASLPGKYAEADADLLLARVEEQCAGCAAVTIRKLSDGTLAAELKRLWVEPAFRKNGIGRALVLAAIQWARGKKCGAVVLDTVSDAMPQATALYQSLQFKQTGRFNDNSISGVKFYILKLTGEK